jgi:hypothetical protein
MKYTFVFLALFSPLAEAQETNRLSFLYEAQKITYQQANELHKKMSKEFEKGSECLQDAKDCIRHIEEIDQVKLRTLFSSSIVALQAKSSPGRCLAFIVAALTELSWDLFSTYFEYIECMEEARSHFEQAEFYRELLIHEGFAIPQFEDISYLLWFDEI